MSPYSSSLPSFESLEGRLMMSGDGQLPWVVAPAAGDALTVDSDTPELTSLSTARSWRLNRYGNGLLAGQLDGASDADLVAFTATQSGSMLVSLSSSTAGLQNLSLVVMDSSGLPIVASEEGVGSPALQSLRFDVQAGNTYYVQASSQDVASGGYLLNALTQESAPTNVAMPAVGSSATQDSLTSSNQAKLYSFTAQASGYVYIDMRSDGSTIDSYLQVYDERGRRISVNNDAMRSTRDSRVRVRVEAGQTYFVKATGYRGTTGAYKVSWNSAAFDDYSSDRSAAYAWRLASNGSGSLRGNINYAGDVDMLAITAPQTGKLTLSMSAGGTYRLDTVLTVLDSSGQEIASNDDNGTSTDSLLTIDVTAGQVFYVQASGFDTSIGRYVVRATTQITPPAPPPPPAPDPTPDPVVPDPTPLPDVTPGAAIAAQVVEISGGLRLVVIGTDGADTITITQSATGITLATSTSSQTFDGVFTQVVIYGFGGNDVLRTANTVVASAVVYGGAGNDSIFVAGPAADTLRGEDGDDLIVSIGGSVDTIYGGAGFDSFWSDSADTIADASAAETSGYAVHRITSFYQPYSTSPSSPSYIATEIAGQNFTDPAVASGSTGYRNFASTPLFTDGPEYNDIRQGNLGDCYLLASLASVAESDPNMIKQMVAPLGDGTFVVRFFKNGQATYLRVDADLAVNGGSSLSYARLSPDGEMWVAVVEKAYAHFRYGQNSFSSIEGGWMGTVYNEVSGVNYLYRWTTGAAGDLANYMTSHLGSGHAVTVASNPSPGNPIAGSHAYMVKSVESSGGTTYVTVYNPWGYDGYSYDSNGSDGLLRLTMAQFQAKFSAVAVCNA